MVLSPGIFSPVYFYRYKPLSLFKTTLLRISLGKGVIGHLYSSTTGDLGVRSDELICQGKKKIIVQVKQKLRRELDKGRECRWRSPDAGKRVRRVNLQRCWPCPSESSLLMSPGKSRMEVLWDLWWSAMQVSLGSSHLQVYLPTPPHWLQVEQPRSPV